MKKLIPILALLLVLASTTQAQVTYTTSTARTVNSLPSLPALGAANSTYTDPTYGATILRVTDQNTTGALNGSWAGRVCHTPGGAESLAWNSDSTKFGVICTGGIFIVYSVTASPLSRTLVNFDLCDDFTFEVTRANIAICADTGTIYDYDVNADTRAAISHGCTYAFPGSGQLSSSYDAASTGKDNKIAWPGNGSGQDNWQTVTVYDRVNGCRYLNTSTGAITGAWGSTGTRTGTSDTFADIHNIRISRDGSFVRISRGPVNDEYIWTISGLGVEKATATSPDFVEGHIAWGWSDIVNVSLQGGASGVNNRVIWRTGATPHSFTNVLAGTTSSSEGLNTHNSVAMASAATELQPTIVSTYGDGTVNAIWEDEIIAVQLTGGTNVWRMAHHRSTANSFDSQPHVNASRDGKYAIYNSDYEGTLTSGRSDVFLVAMPQSGGSPAPTVSSLDVTTGTTAGGTAVVITGTDFVTGATVTYGTTPAGSVTFVSSTTLNTTTPAHASGQVNVVVTNPDAQSDTLVNGFIYSDPGPPTISSISTSQTGAARGSTFGGYLLTITGTNFAPGALVNMDSLICGGVTVVSPTVITCTAPIVNVPAAVDVKVTNLDTQTVTSAGGFTYTKPVIGVPF